MGESWNIYVMPGGENISKDFCNKPFCVQQNWIDEPVVVVLLCGRLAGHMGVCDPTPPMSDVQ